MKKNLVIFLVVFLVLALLIGGFFILGSREKLSKIAKPTPTPEQVVSETPLEQRPYVTLTPRVDGRELTLEISRIKNASSIEYELTYLSNDLSRGVIGTIELKGEDSISRKLLLGSCSRNVCKYDEGVEEGTLTLRFRGSVGTRKFTADFRLQRGGKELTSVDGKFRFTGNLPTSTYYITILTVGLPSPIEGEVVAGPYGIFTAGSTSVKGEVSFDDVGESAKIYALSGKIWEKLEDSQTSLLSTFIAIQ